MISKLTIDEIFTRTQIEEVIAEFVNLKKRGSNLLGLCPFHNEKTPSFTVSPSKNIYKCFGCGRGGNAVQFLMEHEHLTYPEALRFLATKYKIEIEETFDPKVKEELELKESYFIINDFAQQFFLQQLFNSQEGQQIALPYFKERGLLEKTIREFGLGYNPSSVSLTQSALAKGYNEEFMKTLGLTNRAGNDFYRGRVTFPFHNLSGKIIGFGARIMSGERGPKYVNSPESDLYNKKKTLYGLYQARNKVRSENNIFLVEGYTDVLSLSQAGIENVVASSGTSLTEDQIQLIKRFTPNVTILYDGDPAGIKAALRGIDLILEKDLNVKIVLLPEGEDPDSWIRAQGKDKFLEYVKSNQKDFIHFKLDLISQEAKDDPIKKTELTRDIIDSIAKIPDPIKRAAYIQKCSLELQISEPILVGEVNKKIRENLLKTRYRSRAEQERADQAALEVEQQKERQAISQAPEPGIDVNDEFQEKDIVRLLMLAGDFDFVDETGNRQIVGPYLIRNIAEIMDSFDNELYKQIVTEAAQKVERGEALDPAFYLNHEHEAVQRLAIDFNATPYAYSENWVKRWDVDLQTQPMPEKNYKKDSFQSILRFKLRKINKLIRENQTDLDLAIKEKDDEKLVLHLKVHDHLTKLRNNIAEELNTVII